MGYNCNRPHNKIEELLDDAQVVLTGGLCTHFKALERVIKDTRRLAPRAFIVLGGGAASGDPEFMLEKLQPDFIITGEGERAVVELLENISHSRARSQNGRIIKADYIEDLETLPWCDYDLFDVETYLKEQYPFMSYYYWKYDHPRYLPFVSSRGCPYGCTFCYHPVGRRWTGRPLGDFEAELKHAINKYALNLVGIVDETVAVDKGRLLQLCGVMERLRIPWMTQLRVDMATPETMEAMKRAYCFYISWGIESYNEKTLNAMNKQIKPWQIDRALQLCWEYDIGTQGNVLICDLADTMESLMETLFWNMSNNRYGLSATQLIPYPNSPIYQRLYAEKHIADKEEFYRSDMLVDMPKFAGLNRQEAAIIEQFRVTSNSIRPQVSEYVTKIRSPHPQAQSLIQFSLQFKCIWCSEWTLRERLLAFRDVDTSMRIACPVCNKNMYFTLEKP